MPWVICEPNAELQWITGDRLDLIDHDSFLTLPPARESPRLAVPGELFCAVLGDIALVVAVVDLDARAIG